ncbi:MAG TPA: tRNA lysidine(34) synthetase TilS [Gallionella sp.]|nr:tRNA lysidine(34) synthetase TilS [Gallionella sp.]
MTCRDLADRIAAQLEPRIPPRSVILIGLSGGMDSVVLLHLLHRLAPRFSWRLSALHVHHGISPNADAWADFCAGLCAGLDIPLHIEHVDIAPLRGHGIEAAARKLRHAAFARRTCDFVALAHHADDQAETLLLQLLRGSGVRGAAAMPVLSSVEGPVLSQVEGQFIGIPATAPSPLAGEGWGEGGAHRLLRPLLDLPRAALLDYAHEHGLQWVEDESNADDSYPRNFLRHRALPLLEERFPSYRNTLARSAHHFAEASELMDDLARIDAEGAMLGDALNVSALRALTPARAKNLLRHFLHCRGAVMPQTAQLDDMLRQLCEARQDAVVCVEYGLWQVHRYRDRAYVSPALGGFDRESALPWSGEAEVDWPALGGRLRFAETRGAGISAEKLRRAPVRLRLRNGGETLRPHPNAAKRSLKNLLQEHGVPPWRRERLPLVYCGDELVCVVGVAVAAEYQAGEREAAVTVELAEMARE